MVKTIHRSFLKRLLVTMALPVLASSVGVAGAYGDDLIQNGGFESPYLGPTHWSYPGQTSYPGNPPGDVIIPTPTIDGWTYDNSAIVNGQAGSDWYGPIPPNGFGGDQFAALQLTSSLSQTFTSPGGDLMLSWLSAGRPNNYGTYAGDQTYLVELDTQTIGTFSTVSSPPFDVTFSLDTLDLGDVSAGSHTLTFQGLATTDETAFLDNVSIATVPEPSTWAMMLTGFAGLGLAAYRRARSERFTAEAHEESGMAKATSDSGNLAPNTDATNSPPRASAMTDAGGAGI